MDAATFLVALRKRAPGNCQPDDPLATAKRFLAQHAETAEGRALQRTLEGLASGTGKFTESDAWLFSSETLDLVVALIDARLSGRYQEDEWQRACRP